MYMSFLWLYYEFVQFEEQSNSAFCRFSLLQVLSPFNRGFSLQHHVRGHLPVV